MRVLLVVASVSAGLVLAVAPMRAAGPSDEYQLRVDHNVKLEPGDKGAVSLTIAAKTGHRISRDGPITVDVEVVPAKGLVLRKHHYRRRDAADARAADPRFDLAFRAEAVGDYKLTIDVQFWVCARRTCRPVKERVMATAKVVAPPPPADAGVSATP